MKKEHIALGVEMGVLDPRTLVKRIEELENEAHHRGWLSGREELEERDNRLDRVRAAWAGASSNIGITLIILTFVVGVLFIFTYPSYKAEKNEKRFYSACREGRTLDCLNAVRQELDDKDFSSARFLSAVFVNSTGKELPSLEGQITGQEVMFRGYTIKRDLDALVIERNDIKVRITPDRVETSGF